MNLAASRSARLKNKLVMRLGCVLVAVGFLVSSVVTPRARAVAGVDDAVVGSMALASYLSATGVELTVIEGGAGAVSAGMGALAGEYAAATGAAASGEAVLGGIAAGTTLSAAGTIILTAAAVAACAALGYWIYTTYFVDEEGIPSESAVVFSDPNVGIFLADGSVLPIYYSGSLDGDISLIEFGSTLELSNGGSIHSYVEDGTGYSVIDILDASGSLIPFKNDFGSTVYSRFSSSDVLSGFCFFSFDEVAKASSGVWIYFKSSVYPKGNNIRMQGSTFGKLFGALTSMKLSMDAPDEYELPEILPNQGMRINIGADPGTTPQELPDTVPAKILQGDFAPSYELEAPAPTLPSFPGEGQEGPEDVDDLDLPSLGEALTRRFPFSIPWDISRGIMLLAAPAKTPYFEVDFYAPISDLVGGWKGSTKIVLDFSQFESLGRLSRWTSTIGFCLFLASATKRFIWTA